MKRQKIKCRKLNKKINVKIMSKIISIKIQFKRSKIYSCFNLQDCILKTIFKQPVIKDIDKSKK